MRRDGLHERSAISTVFGVFQQICTNIHYVTACIQLPSQLSLAELSHTASAFTLLVCHGGLGKSRVKYSNPSPNTVLTGKFENKYMEWWGDVEIIEIHRDKRWKLTTAEADSISYLIQVSQFWLHHGAYLLFYLNHST